MVQPAPPVLPELLAEPGQHLDRAEDRAASIQHVPIPGRRWHDARWSLGTWKAAHVTAWIGQVPFVWFEDEPDVPPFLAQDPSSGKWNKLWQRMSWSGF